MLRFFEHAIARGFVFACVSPTGVGASPAKLDGPVSPGKNATLQPGEAVVASPGQDLAAAAEATPQGKPLQYAAGQASFSNRHEQVAAAQKAAATEEEQLYMDDEKFEDLQEEIDEKTRKLKILRKKLKAADREMEELQSEFQDEKDDLLESLRAANQELKLYQQITARHCSEDLIQMYEADSVFNDDEDEWTLPKGLGLTQATSAGGSSSGSGGGQGSRGGKPPSGKGGKKPPRKGKENAKDAFGNDVPPSDIGGMSPPAGGAMDGQYNDIMDGSSSDEENGAPPPGRSGGSNGRRSKNAEYNDANYDQGGKYFTEDADEDRLQAGRRVLQDASALKNEMLSAFDAMGNIVLWGGEGGAGGGAAGGGGGGGGANLKNSGSSEDLGPRRAPHRLLGSGGGIGGGLPGLGQTMANQGALPLPGRGGFLDEIADMKAESAVAADAARFNQQQALAFGGPKKAMSDAEELLFVKELTGGQNGVGGNGGGGGKMTL